MIPAARKTAAGVLKPAISESPEIKQQRKRIFHMPIQPPCKNSSIKEEITCTGISTVRSGDPQASVLCALEFLLAWKILPKYSFPERVH